MDVFFVVFDYYEICLKKCCNGWVIMFMMVVFDGDVLFC